MVGIHWTAALNPLTPLLAIKRYRQKVRAVLAQGLKSVANYLDGIGGTFQTSVETLQQQHLSPSPLAVVSINHNIRTT
jgi:hypothetical protein